VHLVANRLWGTYGQLWRYASVQEAQQLLLAGGSSAVVLIALFSWQSDRIPISVLVIGPVVATILMGATRFQSRLFAFRKSAEQPPGLRVAIVGAGRAGVSVLRDMQRSDRLGLHPVVFLDDNPRVQGRSVAGVPVVGPIDDLRRVVHDFDVHQVLLAIPSAGPETVRRVADRATAAGVPVKVLPGVAEMVGGPVSVRDARDLRIDDLLGRTEVQIDLAGVGAILHGRRVLVTGGGGSIGAEIARQVARFEPETLALLDRDETHLYDAMEGLPDFATQILADIRDRRVLDDVFARVRPDVVFHAAAHKHVPILERHASEAVATNVFGTNNVVEAAITAGTERLVCISTDKAVAPTSVMGASKWLAEQIVVSKAPSDRRFCSVRFGNVLGSRGSVIPTFQRQITAGGPVTVTDRAMTRYFMSLGESASLVLQAAAVATDREVFMLEMGEPVNIYALAEKMIQLCGYEVDTDIKIRITGTRPGEKLHEELRAPGEELQPTSHPSIISLRPIRLPASQLTDSLRLLLKLTEDGDDEGVRDLLLDLAAITRDDDDDEPGSTHGDPATPTIAATTL
jgi:FlaA1/EpsC-like NDP-sugar epimerase